MTSVLTDKEKADLRDGTRDIMELIDDVQAAVIKRLAAGVSVEPVEIAIGEYWDCAYQEGHLNRPDGDSANKLLHEIRCSVQTAVAAARVQENERCAEELDGMKCNNKTATSAIKQCAEAIRALLGKEDQS